MEAEIASRFLEGIAKFNSGDFYGCHDILEDLWFDVDRQNSGRNFYQGLIHIAVGFYHITKKLNPPGALLQLNKAIKKLTPFKPAYEKIELSMLLVKIEKCIKEIEKMKSGKVTKFDIKLVPRIKFIK